MKRWERWTFGLLALTVSLSGGAYFWMKYLAVTDDPFAVVNHPWQSAMLAAHVLSSPALLLVFGILLNSHILKKMWAGRMPNRKSGFLSLGSFFVMAATGYLLQVMTSDAALRLTVVLHLGSGVAFSLGYLAHLMIGLRLARRAPGLSPRSEAA